jgi:hypothetical protein
MKRTNRYITYHEDVELDIPVLELLTDLTDDELLAEMEWRNLSNNPKHWNTLDYEQKRELMESVLDKFSYEELKKRLT